jgi:hypothetical protein
MLQNDRSTDPEDFFTITSWPQGHSPVQNCKLVVFSCWNLCQRYVLTLLLSFSGTWGRSHKLLLEPSWSRIKIYIFLVLLHIQYTYGYSLPRMSAEPAPQHRFLIYQINFFLYKLESTIQTIFPNFNPIRDSAFFSILDVGDHLGKRLAFSSMRTIVVVYLYTVSYTWVDDTNYISQF